jgi:hypothetical protein
MLIIKYIRYKRVRQFYTVVSNHREEQERNEIDSHIPVYIYLRN